MKLQGLGGLLGGQDLLLGLCLQAQIVACFPVKGLGDRGDLLRDGYVVSREDGGCPLQILGLAAKLPLLAQHGKAPPACRRCGQGGRAGKEP